jgi:hypothetical protein
MEAITQLVVDSLARHGFDRPVDPRRLQWSRWSRCDTPHSLLVVPSKPGIFALAEEIMDLSTPPAGTDAFARPHVGTAAPGCPAEQSSAAASTATNAQASAADPRRMLAVLQFSEDDDMAFTLDRMFTRINPMRARLASGKCFLRFVVIEDASQRRSICAALNQWMAASAEKATGFPSDFSTSLELNVPRELNVARAPSPASAHIITKPAQAPSPKPDVSAVLDSGASKNLHCPHPLPSGF